MFQGIRILGSIIRLYRRVNICLLSFCCIQALCQSFYFNWRLIYLQCYVDFSCTTMKIRHNYIHTSWQIDGETVPDFIFLGSKITADGDCSHEIKIRLLLGRDIKSRDITLPIKVWKVVVESCEDTGILGPRRRRIQSGARDEAWAQSFCVIKFY